MIPEQELLWHLNVFMLISLKWSSFSPSIPSYLNKSFIVKTIYLEFAIYDTTVLFQN